MTIRRAGLVLSILLFTLEGCSGDKGAGQESGSGGRATASSGTPGSAGAGNSGATGPMATDPGCGLKAAAFCDNFDVPSPGGRGGDRDETKWSVSRVTNQVNPGQGQFIAVPLAVGLICGQEVTGITPSDDYRICKGTDGPRITQTMYDGGGTVVSSFRARQAFDFAGRTGVIAFDLGGRVAGGHGFWPEVLIQDEPSPAPYQDLPDLKPFPRNAIGIELGGQTNCETNQPIPYFHNRVSGLKIINDFAVTTLGPADLTADYGSGKGEPPCIPLSNELMNHYELRLSQTSIELWATDPGADRSTLRLILKKEGLNLPFTRGYVNFQQAHYNAGKDDHSLHGTPMTFSWGNIGFDGPVQPMERGYDVQNSNQAWKDGWTNVGFEIGTDTAASFDFDTVDLTGATEASVNMNVFDFPSGTTLKFRFNEGEWQSLASTLPDGEHQRSLHIPIPLEQLRPGKNKLELMRTGSAGLVAGNIDLTVR
jgi:hypothetical protein